MQTYIVTTAYSIPESRMRNWLEWNSHLWDEALPVIVGHPDIDLWHPCLLRYPTTLDPFCLSKTSNAGIRYAIESGADVIIKTDIDCIIPKETWEEWKKAVSDGHALAPKYRMAESALPKDMDRAKEMYQLVGTIIATAHDWKLSKGYDERMVGYGIEDGDLRDRMLSLGIEVPRGTQPVYHVAHRPGTPQVIGKRRDQWNRNGINPPNREENYSLRGTWRTVGPELA
jgi:hypothetical protein